MGKINPQSVPAITPRCPDNRRELRVHATTVYMYVCIVMTYSKVQINQKVANPAHGQLNREIFPCPRSRLKIWFRETGLAIPSRVSLLILYTNVESGAYSRDSSQCLQRCPYIFTTIHHRASHDFIGSRILRTDGVCCQESVVSKHNHCCTAAVHTVGTFPPPRLMSVQASRVYCARYNNHFLCFKTYR